MYKTERLKDYLNQQETWIYENGDEMSQEEIELIRNATTKKKLGLFKPTQNNKPSNYFVCYACEKCGRMISDIWSKTTILDKNTPFICCGCRDKELNRIMKERKEKEHNQQERFNEKRKHYFDVFLSPNYKWKEDVPQWEKWNDICDFANFEEEIAKAIQKMDYKDFLQTPYWKAVSGEVMKRNDYKCQLCGKNGKLNIHHPDYSIHGYEVQNVKKLLCLCEDCHNKFHNNNN